MLRFARESGFYHDIGKIMVPPLILKKQGRLTADELNEIHRHTVYAKELMMPCLGELSTSDRPYYLAVIEVCLSHHEHWDGTGYPCGLSGTDIPFFARVCTIADSYDAMVSRRLYSRAVTHTAAVDEIRRCGGTQFDPEIAKAFFRVCPDVHTLLMQKGKEPR